MILTATTALPYPHLERATAGLRAELRRQLVAAGVHDAPDWDTFTITGPTTTKDARGNTWFEWAARVQAETSAANARMTD